MRIPRCRPLLGILVDSGEVEMVEQPNMRSVIGVQVAVLFEIVEESLPLAPETLCDIIPEALDPGIVDAPVAGKLSTHATPQHRT